MGSEVKKKVGDEPALYAVVEPELKLVVKLDGHEEKGVEASLNTALKDVGMGFNLPLPVEVIREGVYISEGYQQMGVQ